VTAIEFINVSKSFPWHVGRVLLRTRLAQLFHQDRQKRFVALKHVSFRVEQGESLGVMGLNGAGKSTLLGLAAGLAEPDEGSVTVKGRTAALLELGSGFHPDLTGRENVRLNASLLGFKRQQAEELFERIVDFSGVGEFVDEPLRTYSSGMIVRLAFSVAIHMEPEILLVDEILAVGDVAFQVKCLDRIRGLRESGKTLLIVSHSPSVLEEFCDRAIWLDQGELIMCGRVREVTGAYAGR
jgi:ABC-type polysaccharide/polyol phosphate transport system ATPase subunit